MQKQTQKYFNRVFKTSESNMFSLPGKGLFIVDIFFKKHGEKKSWLCGRFIIEAESGSKLTFPEIYETKYSAAVNSPAESPLIRGKTYNFSVLSEKGNSIVIICGKEIVQLEKNEETHLFTGEFTIPENAGNVLIGITGSSKARSYEILAKYETTRE